jgi:hypothetical protein
MIISAARALAALEFGPLFYRRKKRYGRDGAAKFALFS